MTMFSKNSRAVAAVLLVVAGAAVYLASCPGPENKLARKLGQEPTVTVQGRRIPIEEYVAGVVAGEMKPDWPINAYAAQAILARSFIMNYLAEHKTEEVPTDVQRTQAYKPSQITDVIRQAVRLTRGEVMTHRNRFIQAWFHSYSGGITATAKEGLNFEGPEPPYIQSVRLPDNPYVPKEVTDWEASYSLDQVAALLSQHGVQAPLTDVEITDKGPSGRATEVTISHAGGQTRLHGSTFRLALDPEETRSTLIREMKVEDGRLVIRGAGFGHGVGLSQWDAFMFAKEGVSPEEIVNRFFRGIEIDKLWE